MKAGAAIRDITPKAPIQLCGYPESPISTGTTSIRFISLHFTLQMRRRRSCI